MDPGIERATQIAAVVLFSIFIGVITWAVWSSRRNSKDGRSTKGDADTGGSGPGGSSGTAGDWGGGDGGGGE